MNAQHMAGWILGTMLATSAAGADETTIVSDVLGPEGPLFVEGNLYYVAWTSSTLSKWDGKRATVLNDAAGCGHNGLAFTAHRTFIIACTNDPGALIEVDMTGKELRRWDADSDGHKFAGGINDVVEAANGGLYATVFGPWAATPTDVIGKIIYLAPGARDWTVVADDLNYANGIGVSPDQKTLYVSEMVGNAILKFTINGDGSLSHRANFALLNVLAKNPVDTWWLGPDSLKVDGKGNLYVAQWAGARVLKISPGGKLLHIFPIAAGVGTTNVALGEGGKDLYVTVVKDPDDPQGKGSVVRIPNVE